MLAATRQVMNMKAILNKSCFLRIFKQIIEDRLQIRVDEGIVALSKLSLTVIVSAHWMGCINWMICREFDFPEHSWAVTAGLVEPGSFKYGSAAKHDGEWGTVVVTDADDGMPYGMLTANVPQVELAEDEFVVQAGWILPTDLKASFLASGLFEAVRQIPDGTGRAEVWRVVSAELLSAAAVLRAQLPAKRRSRAAA